MLSPVDEGEAADGSFERALGRSNSHSCGFKGIVRVEIIVWVGIVGERGCGIGSLPACRRGRRGVW